MRFFPKTAKAQFSIQGKYNDKNYKINKNEIEEHYGNKWVLITGQLPGKKKSRNFGLFAGNPAVFWAGFPLVLCFKAGNPQITELNQLIR